MKRLHVHVAVDDLTQSIGFYSTLFAMAPTVLKPDYAKWMLEDPRVNFAISARAGVKLGLDHLGIQVDDDDELAEIGARLKAADKPVLEQGATTCCYAKSDKAWVLDPQGLSWETFLTHGESTVYGESAPLHELAPISACCDRPELAQAVMPPSQRACCGPANDV
ncbi:MAG: ArsI/CadI family heavy metal resistance metalloenzyme [Pseudomonadota bacterium]